MRSTYFCFKTKHLLSAFIAATALIPQAQADLTLDYQNLITNTNGLIDYWNFEDLGTSGSLSTVVNQVSGRTNGTVVGTVDSVLGHVGYAGTFSGSPTDAADTNYVELLNSGASATSNYDMQGSFTIEAMIRTDTLPDGSWTGIITKGDNSWRLARNSSSTGVQGAATDGNGSKSEISNSLNDMNNGNWHYIAMTYDFINGIQTTYFDRTATSKTFSPGRNVGLSEFNVLIGANAQRNGRVWSGDIDEVAFYNTALTQADIDQRLNILDTATAIDEANLAYWAADNATGTFDTDTGWNIDKPTASDIVYIGNNGTVTFSSGNLDIDAIEVGTNQYINVGNTGEGKLIISGGTIKLSNALASGVGRGENGVIEQSGGTLIHAGNNNDFDIANGENVEASYIMTGGLFQIGGWEQDSQFESGWFKTNDNTGDDLAIGRGRSEAGFGKGTLDMSGNSEVRVANDLYLDKGDGHLKMTDNAVLRIGDDFRAGSSDNGTGSIDIHGHALLQVENRFTIADSNNTTINATFAGNANIEVGNQMMVGGKDNIKESGIASLNIEDAVNINIGAYIYNADVGGNVGDTHTRKKINDEHRLYVGAHKNGSGTVNQTGINSTLSVGREAIIGHAGTGTYNLIDGSLIVRGDAPISFGMSSDLSGNSSFAEAGGDLIMGNKETGVGLLNIEGGSLSINRDLVIGLEGSAKLRTKGDSANININGDLYFGGDFNGDSTGTSAFEIALTGDTHTAINVLGGTVTEGITLTGDVSIFDTDLIIDIDRNLNDYRTSVGTQISIIEYNGTRFDQFTTISGAEIDGVEWNVIYDDANKQILVEATKVYQFGDANLDGLIDALDLNTIAVNFGKDNVSWDTGDFNGDGVVDAIDLNVVAVNFNTSNGTNLTAADLFPHLIAVPEPSTLILLSLGSLAAIRRKHA
ncbi:hypothetical protein KS4_02660 [Poriferisphaera corsica]|uniref:LamG-like jellyroll fold domain-containing protein n=1 Tax=Poriferisphaera corsica TaxID=2528020 RepID=A0A517YPS7_9BACT|nr:LamG-like jellyroll fold domain-containing protein [Poriferisphaera corsica]QDU32235.1 hypothetical protein KS4_02660 [Poriferisphaera corsica]